MKSKRKGYFSWDEAFLQVARVIAERSKDPNSQVGACIVDHNNVIVGLGYNGFPRGCSDDELPWNREGEYADSKYAYVVHAEANAVLNANSAVEGARIYSTLFPCNECAKIIIQRGIREVVYHEDKYAQEPSFIAAKRLFDMAGITYRRYEPDHEMKFVKYKQKKDG